MNTDGRWATMSPDFDEFRQRVRVRTPNLVRTLVRQTLTGAPSFQGSLMSQLLPGLLIVYSGGLVALGVVDEAPLSTDAFSLDFVSVPAAVPSDALDSVARPEGVHFSCLLDRDSPVRVSSELRRAEPGHASSEITAIPAVSPGNTSWRFSFRPIRRDAFRRKYRFEC